jgi:hypothetical protein
MNVIADLFPGFAERSIKTAGAEIVSGHFLAEENPKDTLAALLPFLSSRPERGSAESRDPGS